MPIISFANPKGGSGKTTSALLLAGELVTRGARVTIIDADPERWITKWSELPGIPSNLQIVSDVTEDSIVDTIEAAHLKSQFVIVDLEGTASLMVANAIGMSDLVVIPMQGASMDSRGAAKTIKLIHNQARITQRTIRHSILLTRTSAALATRSLKSATEQLSDAGVERFATEIVERAAYREIFEYGGLLAGLPPHLVSNIDKARANARAFAGEVITKLKSAQRAKVA